ncbi:MAG: sodium/proline symporter PutP [Bacteroidales bacterium]|jgi:sodium/proline symporter|nr:sodium/proline symporter PutP [Bacteroidales bacterium]
MMNTATIISFSIYIVGMLAIGFYFYYRTQNISDYVLGGRGLNPVVAALSAGASDMSGWLLLGLPGLMYTTGISGSWIAIGLTIGAFLNWHYIARPLRNFTEKLDNSITIPGFIANRFDSKNLRIVSSIVILIFYTLYASSGLVGGAKLFEATFNLDYQTALIAGTLVIVSYTFLGGYNAVSWTDFFQGTLMMLALLVVPIIVIRDIGSFSETIRVVRDINPEYLNIRTGTTFIGIISLLAWGLGYFGQPHILVRFMSINRVENVSTAKYIGMSWMIVSIAGSLMVGFFGIAYVAAQDISLLDSEKIFIRLSELLLNPWIAGFVLAAILAAIMSTIDSQLLVSSSCLTRDIYEKVIKQDASDRELVWIGRATVIAIAIIAFYISTDQESTVLSLVAYAWAGFGAAFGPLIILSLYHKNISAAGALAGMITGAATVLIWKQLEGGIFELYEILPGFIFALLAIGIFSKLFPARQELKDRYTTIRKS